MYGALYEFVLGSDAHFHTKWREIKSGESVKSHSVSALHRTNQTFHLLTL